MEKKAPVSVIIPCYRCINTIERAIISIVQQSVLPEEVILVDDCSNDGTLGTLYDLKDKYRDFEIRIIKHDINRGPGAARNSGWEIAAMPYIAFLDADDTWHPQKLEIQYNIMVSYPEIDVCGHKRGIAGNDNSYTNSGDLLKLSINDHNRLTPVKKYSALLRNPFSTITVMLKRDIEFRFEPGKYHSEDYLLWLTCLLSGLKVSYLEATLAYIYKQPFGENGLSKDLIAMQKGNMANYSKLYNIGLLSKWEALLFKALSALKFIRRLFLWKLNYFLLKK